MKKYISANENETYLLGKQFGEHLGNGAVVALFAELGSGKTVFAKGIAASFHIDDVHSPTFTIVNEYYGDKTIYHFDAYRINADDWVNGGFDEYLFGDGICIIEWAENIEDILPDNTIKITINRDLQQGENYRTITIEGEDF